MAPVLWQQFVLCRRRYQSTVQPIAFAQRNLHIEIGSQGDGAFLEQLCLKHGSFNVIIDDGQRNSEMIRASQTRNSLSEFKMHGRRVRLCNRRHAHDDVASLQRGKPVDHLLARWGSLVEPALLLGATNETRPHDVPRRAQRRLANTPASHLRAHGQGCPRVRLYAAD